MKCELFRIDYPSGNLDGVRNHNLFVWAAVHMKTGEVEMMSIEVFDDELRKLSDGWEWRKFCIIEVNDN